LQLHVIYVRFYLRYTYICTWNSESSKDRKDLFARLESKCAWNVFKITRNLLSRII